MSKKEEEMADVVKRYQGLETEKDTAETQLTDTNQKLEDTEKRAQEVGTDQSYVNIFNSMEYTVMLCFHMGDRNKRLSTDTLFLVF